MKPRKATKGKKTARKGRRAAANPLVRLSGTLAPQHMITQLKYVNTYQKSNPVGGAVASFNQFRMNSIWDPDLTAVLTGTSCLGLQQWRQLYQRYRVFKFDYKITLTNISEDSIVSGAIVPANYQDSAFSISDMMRPLARRFELGNRSGQNRAVLKGSINLPKLVGLTPAQYKADASQVSGFAANPASSCVLTILAQPSNGGVATSIGVQVDFTYHVEMMSTESGSEALDHSTGLSAVPAAVFCT